MSPLKMSPASHPQRFYDLALMGWGWGHGERGRLLSWSRKGDSACRGVGAGGRGRGFGSGGNGAPFTEQVLEADPRRALDAHNLRFIFTATRRGRWQMGWDSERLRNLPKVTKLIIKAAEPQAKAPLKGSRVWAIDHWVSRPRSQTQDLWPVLQTQGQGLRILMNESDNLWNSKAQR